MTRVRGYEWFQQLKFAFPVATVAALALLLISEGSYRRSLDSMQKSQTALDMRVASYTFVYQLTVAETAQRGFLLTHRASYLQPFRGALEITATRLSRILTYYGNDPVYQAEVLRLTELYVQKVSEMKTVLELYAQGKHDVWHNLLLTDIGREKMATISEISLALLRDQVTVTNNAQADVKETLLLNRIGVGAMVAVSLLALFMFMRQSLQLDLQRIEQREALQAERDKLESEVARRTLQLTELAHHLQTAREDERSRLARELHDELGGLLTAAKFDVARMKSKMAGAPQDIGDRIAHLIQTLDAGIALKRRIIEDLRPSSLSNLGLVAALSILVAEFSERTGIEVSHELSTVTLTPETELTVYRMVQEALTNITKYAKATQVDVNLRSLDGQVQVTVSDNGVGFDQRRNAVSAHGLLGMRYRIEAAHGELNVDSAPGRGTRLQATLPGT